MNDDLKYTSVMSSKNHIKARKRKTSFPIFILLFVTISIFVIYNWGEQIANQISNSTLSVTQSNVHNSSAEIQATDAWSLMLVNTLNHIPDNFKVTLVTLKNNYQVDKRIYSDLQEMFNAARNAGIYPLIGEAYRTAEQQQKLLTDKNNAYIAAGYSKSKAEALALTWVAIPGASEHQLGLALDINAENDKCTNKSVYQWLAKNSYKYGFILRYPLNKVKITGTNYEPWHYRYVGTKAAGEIYTQGICLEEYLNIH